MCMQYVHLLTLGNMAKFVPEQGQQPIGERVRRPEGANAADHAAPAALARASGEEGTATGAEEKAMAALDDILNAGCAPHERRKILDAKAAVAGATETSSEDSWGVRRAAGAVVGALSRRLW